MKTNLGILGVIILAALVFIIASITYTYIESIRIKPDDEISDYIQGKVIEINQIGSIEFNKEEYILFTVNLENTSNITLTYDMFFYDLYPPLEQMSFRFYYDLMTIDDQTVYRIVRVEMI